MKNFLLFLMLSLIMVYSAGCKKKKEMEETRKTSPNMDTTVQKIEDDSSKTRGTENLDESLLSRRTASDAELSEEIKRIFQDVHFEFDMSNIRAEDIEILKAVAAYLESNPDVHVQIEGHCDERGSNEYNVSLGDLRANAILKFFTAYGIKADRLNSISYGEEKPLDRSGTEEAHAVNRRGHFNILK